MASMNHILAEISEWKSEVVPIVESVLSAMAKDTSEDQFSWFKSSGDTYYALVDVIRNIAYIDALSSESTTDQAREMMSLQSQFVREYPDMDLIINIERIVPRLNDLLSLDLLKLALFTKRVKKIYIIGSQEHFNSFVEAAINIHKKVVDADKFQRYESLADLPQIIKEIERSF
ncbi:MAG TPA: hypothetical protein VF209_02045 [Patescibacteria group bacterium]